MSLAATVEYSAMRWIVVLFIALGVDSVSADARFYVSRLAPDSVKEVLREAVPVLNEYYHEEIRLQYIPLIGSTSDNATVVIDEQTLGEVDDLENNLYRWLHEEWGFRHFVPGEYAVVLNSTPTPFSEWLKTRGVARRYITRNLHDVGRERYGKAERLWSNANRLKEKFSFNHAHFRIIRPEHFETNPEWFAKDAEGNPKRPPYPNASGFNDHPDLSREDVVEKIAAAVIERFEQNPGLLSVSIGANDSFEFGHFAEEYPWFDDGRYFRRYPDYSNHVFQFSNRVAEKVAGVFPDKYLGALAYLSWENVPDFNVHPSIIPYLTADRSQWYDNAFRLEDIELVQSWSKSGPEIIGTWDYIFGYGFLIPRSLTAIVADSIPEVFEAGAEAYFSQVSPLWAFDGHTTWLAAQLLDDVDADPELLVNEFFEYYYGPAADSMRKFFAVAEFIWMNQPGNAVWLRYYLDAHQAWLFNEFHMKRLRELLDKALLASRQWREETGDSVYLRRVSLTDDAFVLTECFVEYTHLHWYLSRSELGPVHYAHERRPAFVFENYDVSSLEGVRSIADRLDVLKHAFVRQRERMLSGNPVHQRFEDSDWAFFGDSIPRRLWQLQRDSIESELVFSTDWERDKHRWRRSLLDSKEASLALGPEGVRAEKVRRGQLFCVIPVDAGEVYAADVRLRGVTGPSANIFVRLDWYDSEGRQLSRSPWDRLPPGIYDVPFQLGPVERAPESAAFVRLFIRFYEQEKADWIEIDQVGLYRLAEFPR